MNSRRWYALIALAVFVAMVLVGCAKKAAPTTQEGTGGSKAGAKDLRLVVRQLPKVNIPFYKLSLADPLIYSLMYDTLLLDDSAKGLQPLLADEWQLSDDKKALTFKLNPNATFHSGEPVLAKDVVASFVLIAGGALSPRLALEIACYERVEEVGEREVKFTLKQECPDAPKAFGTKILIINDSSMLKGGFSHADRQPKVETLSSSGAFAVDKQASVEGKKLVMRATGKHYRLHPMVTTVTFELVEDENVAESSVKTADVWPQIFGP